jgi:CO/xanthine dehydrogenase FAD-binding subunit
VQYFEPNFVNEALVVLDRFGSKAKILAGGTLLGPQLRGSAERADALVNIKRISSLNAITIDGATLTIGALATAQQIASHPLVCRYAPLVASAAASLGARQLRSAATIGGNVCSGHHSADLATALLASGARVAYAALDERPNELPIERFLSPGFHGLAGGALITAIALPILDGRTSYVKAQTRRAFEMALVCVAALVQTDGATVTAAHLALGGAAPTPILAIGAEAVLAGQPLRAESIRETATVAADVDADPRDDDRAGADYRRHLVRVLVERALTNIANDRIGEQG